MCARRHANLLARFLTAFRFSEMNPGSRPPTQSWSTFAHTDETPSGRSELLNDRSFRHIPVLFASSKAPSTSTSAGYWCHPRSHVTGRDRATRGSNPWQSLVEKGLSRNPSLTGNHLVGVEPQLCNETVLVRKVMHKGAECRKVEDCQLSPRRPRPLNC